MLFARAPAAMCSIDLPYPQVPPIAPSFTETAGLVTILAGSISRCAPRPSHDGQAPYGELKENIRGASSVSDEPQLMQAIWSENSRARPPFSPRKLMVT